MGLARNLVSISTIQKIEDAYTFGACSTLGEALDLLIERLEYGLQDSETLGQALFLCWYSNCEPSELTGLSKKCSLPEDIMRKYKPGYLEADIEFMLGFIANKFSYAFGNEDVWSKKYQNFFEAACKKAPSSQLFASWKYFIELEPNGFKDTKTNLINEIRARYEGRGYMGSYMQEMLTTML